MNHFQVVVDGDAAAGEVDRLAERALEWLIDEHIVEESPSRCVPDRRKLGHRPGEDWQAAIVELDEYFLSLDFNGVQVEKGRQIFDAGTYDPMPYCPHCNQPRETDGDRRQAINAWQSSAGDIVLQCPHCERSAPLVDWRHDPPIGFGCLGFRFWNWPSLNREFIERLAAVLGHRLILVEGRAG